MSESFEKVCTSYDYCTWVGRDGVKRAIDRLKAAHESEITEALCDACDQCDRMDKKAYEHEIEHLRKAEYHRGYVAGQRSMDADHAAVATKLRGLRFGGGSHENLGKIAYAIYPCATGWTCESCEGLRDKIIDLLGGVHDEPVSVGASGGADCNCTHHRCNQRQVSYDELGNERHKAVCELRKVCTKLDESVWTWIEDVAIAIGAQDNQSDKYESMLPKITDRLIHLLDGVHKPDAALPTYDVLGNERHKAVCELRNMQLDTGNAIKKLAVALGLEWNPNNAPKSVALLQNRIIHLLGGDEPNLQKSPILEDSGTDDAGEVTITDELRKMDNGHSRTCPKSDEEMSENAPSASITDELRKFKGHINTRTTPEMVLALRAEINCIADRIDEQFDRICEQQEKVLQQTIDEMTEFREHDAEYALGERDYWHQQATDTMNHADAMEHERDNLLDLLRDARDEYKMLDQMSAETSANFHAMRDRVWGLEAERDELQEKCDRLKAKVEHQREQLAVYATMYDFDTIRALKRERNEHKHRADNAEGHAKSLDRRLDAAHETYCALLNDAAREFRALTEERDELRRSLRQIAERTGVPHDMNLSEYSDKKIANAVIGQLGETKQYVKSLEWVRDRRLPRIEAKRDELLAKLDNYNSTHIALPKDEDGEVIHVGDELDGYAKTIEVVELRYGRSGWVIVSRDGNAYADTYAFAHHHEPTVEQVIRDLTFGKITEAQAIERIEGIHGQG